MRDRTTGTTDSTAAHTGPAGPGGRGRTGALAVLAALTVAAATAGCTAQAAGQTHSAASAPPAPSQPADTATEDAEPADTPAPAPVTSSPDLPDPSGSPGTTAPPSPTPDPQGETLMANGSQGRQVRELQARLRQIGHFDRSPTGYYGSVTAASVSSFQSKRGLVRTGRTDTLTWRKLLGMTREPTAGELDPPTTRPAAKPDKRCLTGRVLCISKNSRTLSWMIDGRVVSSMDVRFGSQYTPTREGTFSVYWKSRDHVSTIYHTPMPYAMFFSGGQAVHYSADFAARGYDGASHGCVNVRDKAKIAALFDQVRDGDKVVVYG